MAACKAAMDAAHGIPGSSLVTTMARNGTEFGIRVSGLKDQWFTGPSQVPRGLYFAGQNADDANPRTPRVARIPRVPGTLVVSGVPPDLLTMRIRCFVAATRTERHAANCRGTTHPTRRRGGQLTQARGGYFCSFR